MVRRVRNTAYACEADAQKAAKRDSEKAKARFHDMKFEMFAEHIETLRKGSPRKDAPERIFTTSWVVQITFVDKAFNEAEIKAHGWFVLLTTITDRRKLSDADLLRAYKEQQVVELEFKWLKGPLTVAPVFLRRLNAFEPLRLFLRVLCWFSD